jgi:HAD superfamily hydrolase (TIGR01509 family)
VPIKNRWAAGRLVQEITTRGYSGLAPLWLGVLIARVSHMKERKLAILDIDGTLLLSNDAHARAFVEAAESLGVNADFNKIRRLIGKGADKLIPEAFGIEAECQFGKRLGEAKKKIFELYLPSLQPAPGARDLLLTLQADDFELAVATSAGKEEVALLLNRAGVKDLIEEIATSDDAESSKPDPDIIRAALSRAGGDARAAIMIGDTPYDVEAALRAGVRIITVRCGGLWTDAALSGSLAIYDDPADILAHYEIFEAALINS